VKTKVDGKEKIIRFGEQGASTAGKPKEGESDRMKAKRASFKSRHAKNIAKGPASAAYWADKVKWADGGSVRTHYAEGDSVRAIPQNAALGKIAQALQSAKDYTNQYEVKQWVPLLGGTGVGDMLMGKAPEEVENWSYGNYPMRVPEMSRIPQFKTGRAESFGDTLFLGADAVPVVGALGKVAGKAGKAGARVVGEELNRALLDNTGVLAKMVPQAAKPMYVVQPQGNLNFKPIARAEILKGPEAQTPENFLNQLRGKPGMTQEGFDDLAKRYQGLEPNTRMTKAEFEQNIPASQYNKVDLVNSAESADAHLLQQAEDMVMEDRFNIYEGMLDRLGARPTRENLTLLDEYHNNNLPFEQLTPDLQRGLTRVEATTPDRMNVLDDIFAEERQNAVNNTFETLREQDYAYSGLEPGGYAYKDYQRLLVNPKATDDGYFEIGVSHPDQMSGYKHYPGHEGDEGLIGHVRGTFIPADAADDARRLFSIRLNDEKILAKPNSMIIEEIQSDAQKGKAQSGALRQAHGTMFKAAIQHALENGVDTVYYPTAKTIGGVRLTESSKYAPIYDQQIVKEGLKPLLKIPGVDSNKISDAYYEINFTPEAKDFILKGEGQAAPGYAEGGSVSAYDPFQVDEIMNTINAPRGYSEGGGVRGPDMEFTEDPEALRLYKHAMKQTGVNREETASNVGTGIRARVGGGDFSAGLDMTRMTQGQRDQLMKNLAANYNINLGDLNLNARVEKPLDAKDVYVGMLNGSIPLGAGQAMLGVQGMKTPYGGEVLGYNAGYSGKVGPGHLSVNVNKPKRGSPSGQVQYQMPFAEGGSAVKNAATDFMKFLDNQGLSMSDVVAAFGKRGMPLSAAFYSGELNTDEDLELRKRRKQKPTIDEPKYAQGGSVSAYDPSRVDAILNQFM
jgi:hypothetical protein